MRNRLELSPQDTAHLERACLIGRLGWGQVHPNPMVGCVLARGEHVVAEGHHEVFGGPHAEIVALERALGEAEGATAYVSLEPCDHHGKTPPCSRSLVEAGVRRVVFGARDPGADSGGGAETLRAEGVEVVGPVWAEARARAENPAFFHLARHGTPFVALKLAMTLDAKIAARAGERTRITGAEADREVHRLRTGFDAVMVGAGTVRADDPRLTPRLVPPGREPTRRIVLVPDARIEPDAALFEDVPGAPVHVFCRDDASEIALERLESAGASVHPVPTVRRGGARRGGQGGTELDLDAVLAVSRELGIRSILCEGGGRLAARLLHERRVARVYVFVSPTTLGNAGLAAFPPDAELLEWDDFVPAFDPEAHGRDTLIVLDRQER